MNPTTRDQLMKVSTATLATALFSRRATRRRLG